MTAMIDISLNGIYVTVPGNLQEDAYVRIEVFLPGQETSLTATGRIAWDNTGNNRPKPFYPKGYGIELTDFENTDEELMADFLNENLSQQGQLH